MAIASQPDGLTKIRIAIIGGGIMGLSLAIALHKIQHIDVHIFEAAETFRERGAGVGITVNGQRAMETTDPELRKSIDLGGAVKMLPGFNVRMGSGPHDEELIFSETVLSTLTVQRYEWLSQLVALVPPSSTHVNKKLVAIDEHPGPDGGVTLHFADGSTHDADAVIGADGMHSFVRKQVLGAEHPAVVPQFGKSYCYWMVLPVEKVQAALGTKYLDDHTQIGWIGDGAFLMNDFVTGGNNMQVVAALHADEWPYEEMWARIPKEKSMATFENWGKWGRDFVDLLTSQPDVAALGLFEHPDAPTYTRGRVCLAGDAAHAHTPWQGAGASQCLEDTLVLSHLLKRTTDASLLPSAFQAYDVVRRPRTQNIAKTSRESCELYCGRDPAVGLDVEKMKKRLAHHWDHIYHFDLEAHCREAEKLMERFRSEEVERAGSANGNGNGNLSGRMEVNGV